MELTAAAAFLNTAFAGYDNLILSLLSKIQCGFLTFLFKLITLIGEKGIVFFLAALVFMLFPKTRKLGVCLFGAVACGALITNIILKDLIARPRPLTVEPYMTWWKQIGAPAEDEFSFPSGHATAAAAGMVALRLMKGKKWTVPAIVWILLTMIARNYLMAHYPSDVLAGALIGTASAFIAWFITRFIFNFLQINRRQKWAEFVLTWSLPDFAGIPSKLGLTGSGDAEDDGEDDRNMDAYDAYRRGSGRTAARSGKYDDLRNDFHDTGSVRSRGSAHDDDFVFTRGSEGTHSRISGSAGSSSARTASTGRASSGYRGKHER